jgi:hypothetical protein
MLWVLAAYALVLFVLTTALAAITLFGLAALLYVVLDMLIAAVRTWWEERS